MNLEVLVSTMTQVSINNLIKEMNIKTNAIIINQCDNHSFNKLEFNGNQILVYSFAERGVGLSRNSCMMRATADICVFADDDEVFLDDYEKIIITEFKKNPKADVILFNVESLNKNRPTFMIKKNKKVRTFNCLKYGAVNIAFRRESILKANISFSLLFGGGAKYSAGEDSLFIFECLKKGLKVYSNIEKIAYVKQVESTWFSGYNDKYFIDKGFFFKTLSKKLSFLFIAQYAVRKYPLYKKEKKFKEAIKLMIWGAKEW